MKSWLIAALLVAASASAQAPRRLIVQFHELPAALRGVSAPQAYDSLFSRFRADLDAIEPWPVAAKPGPSRVHREFFRSFAGASVEITRRESIAAIGRLPYVAAVHPDLRVEAYALEDGGSIAAAGAPAAGGGAGVVVAVIDSGVDYMHPALGGGIGPGRKVAGGYDFVNDDGDPMDDHGHGTHVAGIIGAKSATLSGVAPEVTLLVYKVLNAQASGLQSDVIAAIELSLDPNGDGDLSDRADIANLSLGARGNPLDPVSIAVEAAVASGMVVVAAAGNDGLFHFIGSPASADSAIAVGASDQDGALAEFSNRGPTPRTGAIKPDVLAPGVSIRSAAIGGGTRVRSGTSMAAPWVTGAAALILERHPEWSPLRVKAALAGTASPLAHEEVMSQGSGIVDLSRALESGTWASRSQLSFGLADLSAQRWTTTATISITNDSSAPRSFAVSSTGDGDSVTISSNASSFGLAAGEARELTVNLDADVGALGEPSESFAWGGFLVLRSDEETLRIPWAFLKAARVIVDYDREFPLVALVGRELTRASFAYLDPKTVEVLLAPGPYDVIVSSAWEDSAELVIVEEKEVRGNVVLHLASTDAVHALTLDGRDERGQPFPDGDGETALYLTDTRLLLESPGGLTSLQLDRLVTRTLHTSTFSDRFGLLFTESFIDGETRRMYVVQHGVVSGADGARTLTGGGSTLESRAVHLGFPADATRREVGILARGEVRRPFEINTSPLGVLTTGAGGEWSGTLFMTPEVHPDYASGVQLFLYSGHGSTQGLASMTTPMLRLKPDGFVSMRPFDPPPLPVEVGITDSFDFRGGAFFPSLTMSALDQGWAGTLLLLGQRFEGRMLERAATSYRVVDANGAQIAAGPVGLANPLFIALPRRGTYRASFVTGSSTLDLSFDTRGDGTPPVLTSFAVLDAGLRKVSSLPSRGSGSVVFSLADYEVLPAETRYRRLPATPSVSFRRAGGAGWTPLSVVGTGEETEASGRGPVGLTFRADVGDALHSPGEIELRIEVSDEDGNRLSWMTTAFTVEQGETSRRRAVRR